MNWQDLQVSIYSCHCDKKGRPATLREVLFTSFGVPHRWFKPIPGTSPVQWESGEALDISTIVKLRTTNPNKTAKSALKDTLQGFTPSGLLSARKDGKEYVTSYTGLLQLDFDSGDLEGIDLEEFKRAVFGLSFTAFTGLSCSGKGVFALLRIPEPERLADYAEHCFNVFGKLYGIQPDTSKGRNANDLRYISYDQAMMHRDHPTKMPALPKVVAVRPTPLPLPTFRTTTSKAGSRKEKLLEQAALAIANAYPETGQRFEAVQKWGFTLGGAGDLSLLTELQHMIRTAPNYADRADHYSEVARQCFQAGTNKPLTNNLIQ